MTDQRKLVESFWAHQLLFVLLIDHFQGIVVLHLMNGGEYCDSIGFGPNMQ